MHQNPTTNIIHSCDIQAAACLRWMLHPATRQPLPRGEATASPRRGDRFPAALKYLFRGVLHNTPRQFKLHAAHNKPQ